MIPGDLAARLRMISEASFFDSEPPVQGTARVREIQSRLPQLLPGQPFTAHITRALPDGTFQALIAGQNYTLALGQSAKPGDTLELIVTRNTHDAIFARAANLGNQPALGQGTADLSPTGRLISFLLSGSSPAQTAPLNSGQPLLNAPPTPGSAALAPALQNALAQSGLFYEAHQQQWIAGQRDTAALQQEPQGQHSLARGVGPPPSGAQSNPAQASAAQTAQMAVARVTADGTPAPASAAQSEAARQQAAINRITSVPERLVPIVHQQLDAMASQNYAVHGQAWPGQHFEWEIYDPERQARADAIEEKYTWRTTLRLHMEHLGHIEAHLQLTPKGVAVRIRADNENTLHTLSAAQITLAETLDAVKVPLTGFATERHSDE